MIPRPGWSGRRRAVAYSVTRYITAALAIALIVWAAIVLFLAVG